MSIRVRGVIKMDNNKKIADICGNADIIIGIPSLNEADTIAFVAEQLAIGLKKYFSNYSSVIINADNNSKDGTKDAFLNADTGNIPKRYISTGENIVGKGNNMRNLFMEVERLKAKAVIVVDADLKSVTPEWTKSLVTPILEGHDYITPLYSRNEYDGTITNHVIYPLIYGLFKSNIRQPIGGDFAFSPKMAKYWLDMEWGKDTRQYGIDIFMTSSALLNGFKLGQVVLGSKVHKPSAPKLGPMFTQVVTTIFSNISQFKDTWMNKQNNKECSVIGNIKYDEPQELPVDYKSIRKAGFDGFAGMDSVISTILTSSNYEIVKKMYLAGKWKIGPGLWTKIIYDFIFAYEMFENKEEVVEALKPLYFARAASFFKQTMDMSHKESENEIVKQAGQFQKTRGYLINKFKK